MKIKPMTDKLASDWFEFFDNRAFADHPDWKGCYCTGPFTPQFDEYASKSPIRREYAKWLVEHGKLKGYLAYQGGIVVGWCNVNLRSALPKYNDSTTESDDVLAIACFVIQKDYRRQGIAQALLRRVMRDARSDGIKVVEAYPRTRVHTESGNFRGPYAMYEKNGFVSEMKHGISVMRKYL